jgi:tetratricopeptide (TPR) repeat protein
MVRPKKAVKRQKAKQPTASYRRTAPRKQNTMPVRQRRWVPWLLLGFVATVAYFNACHDTFVYDDREFLADGRSSGLGLVELIGLFSESLWEASGNTVSLYRPLLTVSLGLESRILGDWAVGYHLVNVLLHVLSTMLVFGLVREVLRSLGNDRISSSWAALMATMIFVVHPVHSEVVNSVFNGSEIYMTICVVGGLWYLLVRVRDRPLRAWLLVSVLYLCALLYRENAVSMPALAVTLLWMTSDERWTIRLQRCLPVLLLLLPLAIYLGLRVQALEAPDGPAGGSRPHLAAPAVPAEAPGAAPARPAAAKAAAERAGPPPPAAARLAVHGLTFDSARLAGAVSMWFDALKLMVWPHPLLVSRDGSTTPLLLALGAQLALWLVAVHALLRKRPALATGLAVFYLAILPLSRIVSADIPAAILLDRMLYLPSVGLVICMAAGLLWVAHKSSIRRTSALAAVIVMLLTPVTWARNHDWADEVRLLEGDFAKLTGNRQILISLIKANSRFGNTVRSVQLCEQFSTHVRDLDILGFECAKAYSSAKLHARAEDLFTHILARNPRNGWVHFELARLQVKMGQRSEARAHFDAAIEYEALPFLREFMSAVMLIELFPNDRSRLLEAREHVRNALQLQPRESQARELLQYLNQRL